MLNEKRKFEYVTIPDRVRLDIENQKKPSCNNEETGSKYEEGNTTSNDGKNDNNNDNLFFL